MSFPIGRGRKFQCCNENASFEFKIKNKKVAWCGDNFRKVTHSVMVKCSGCHQCCSMWLVKERHLLWEEYQCCKCYQTTDWLWRAREFEKLWLNSTSQLLCCYVRTNLNLVQLASCWRSDLVPSATTSSVMMLLGNNSKFKRKTEDRFNVKLPEFKLVVQ